MPVFKYEAVKRDGARVNGTMEAQGRAAVLRLLDEQQLQPLSIKAHDGAAGAARPAAEGGPARLKMSQVILFTEDLSDLLEAGLQLEGALKVIEERPGAASMQRVAASVRQQVREGTAFSTALKQASPSFDELYVSMAAAGEAAGVLAPMLRRQASYLVVIEEIRARLQQALVYPAFIVAAGIVILVLFMTVLLPELNELFRQTQGKLPLATRIMVGTAGFVAEWWYLIIGGILVASMLFRGWLRTEKGRAAWDRISLRLPLAGPVLKVRFYSRFSRTLASLVGHGIPLLNALQLTTRATPNRLHHEKLQGMIALVGDGGSLSRAMKLSGVFPQLFIDVVGVGERTGELERALERAAERYERDLGLQLNRLMSLIQPAVILVIALGVGLVAYSVVNTILEAVSSLRSRY